MLKRVVANLILLAVSCTVTLLLCEPLARMVLNPADYLSVEMVSDPVMGAVPSATARAGFDSWGFRNRAVPSDVDIVAIGDSHTYGNTATMDDSWPYVVERATGRTVYNMGLGGYGPNQYFNVLQTKALALKPRMVIVGLYMGDDFENAYLITYGLDHWASLRQLPKENVNFDIWVNPATPSWHKKIRVWLSRHSVVYQVLFHASILGRLQGDARIRNASSLNPEGTTLTVPEKHIEEAFLPVEILRRLDQQSVSVKEGMRITYKLLKDMDQLCRQHGIQFMVVVIPTKEMVFAEYLQRDAQIPLHDVMVKLIANQRIALDTTFAFLSSAGIRYVDTLPRLTAAVDSSLYTRNPTDMHLGKNGYRVVGEAVSDALRQARASN